MTRDRLSNYFTREVILRLLASIALALILWALVTLRQNPETSRTYNEISVQALSLNESLVLVNAIDPVTVELTGPESEIDPIENSALVATVDFSSVEQPGVYELPVELTVPDGVWRSSVNPPAASVTVERSESKDFRLVPVISDLDENSLRTVTVYPEVDQATVTGPSSRIDSIAQVALPVEVSGGTRTVEGVYVPEARDADGVVVEGVTIEPAAVNATVRISARGKSVAVLSTIVGTPAPGYEVTDRTINPQFVIVDGDESVLESIVALSTEPIDVTGADSSFNKTVAIAGLPDGVQILQPSNGMVDVLVQITQRGVHQSLPSQQVTVEGVEPGLVASTSPTEIIVEVIAPQDTLAALDSSSIKVVVDANGLEAGTYSIQPSVILPPGVQWESTVPTEIELTLTSSGDSSPSAGEEAAAGAATP